MNLTGTILTALVFILSLVWITVYGRPSADK
jgi:hypothetical protein